MPRTRSATWCSSISPRSAPWSPRATSIAEVESTKSVAEIYAPCAGTIAAVNSVLAETPEQSTPTPTGTGWFVDIDPDDPPRSMPSSTRSGIGALIGDAASRADPSHAEGATARPDIATA